MKRIFAVLLALMLVSGCGGKAPESAMYTREGLDLNYIDRIAVLPFENLTDNQYAARRVRDIALTEIMASGKFEVVDKGIVDSVLQEMTLSKAESLDAPLLKILGKRLRVKALLTGTINNIQGGSGRGAMRYPEISLTLHLIDTETAQVLWRSTAYRNGYSLLNRLFDLDPRDEFEVTLELLQEMVASIPK